MKYFIFSDAHICDGTYKDDFSQTFQADMRFIERLELIQIRAKVDKFVGAGDLFELWQTTHNKIKNAHYIVWDWIMRNVKLLKGNHDFSTFAPQTMKFTTKTGSRVMITHGHQSNPKMLKWYTRGIIYIVGKLERWFPWLDNPQDHPKLHKLLPKKYRKVFEEKMHEQSSIEKDVEEYCKSFIGKVDIMIVGHTHRQQSKILKNEKGAIFVLNCGHCTTGAFQGVLFDTENDKWSLV